jgi:tetratricopeptide (TPR) repeat protein
MFKIPATLICLLFLQVVQADTIKQMQNELKQGQFARAATTGLSLLRKQPKDIQLQFLTALAFQKNNQPRQAIRYYKTIIDAHPELPEPRNNLAIIYQQQGEYDKAVKLLIDSLNTDPVYATAWKNLNNIYQALASEAYRKALSDDKQPHSMMDKISLTTLETLQQNQTSSDATQMNMLASVSETQSAAAVTPEVHTATTATAPTPVSTPASTPASTPVSAPAPAPVTIVATAEQTPALPDKNQMIQLLKDWAAAWSNQDFDHYVSAYSNDYTGRYPNHKEWLKQRRKRVINKDRILVTLTHLTVKLRTSDSVVIDFQQAYQSPSYSDKVAKRIHLQRIDNEWKIQREVTLAVL